MEKQAPSMILPAIVAGAGLGFLSGIPFSHCACCLWAAGAGLLAAFLYSKKSKEVGAEFRPGKGAVLGLLTGFFFAVVGSIVFSAINLALGQFDPAAIADAAAQNPMADPAQVEQFIEILESTGPALLVLVIFFMWLAAGAIFATIGGLIGGSVFKSEPAASPPMAGDPPPPPVTPGG